MAPITRTRRKPIHHPSPLNPLAASLPLNTSLPRKILSSDFPFPSSLHRRTLEKAHPIKILGIDTRHFISSESPNFGGSVFKTLRYISDKTKSIHLNPASCSVTKLRVYRDTLASFLDIFGPASRCRDIQPQRPETAFFRNDIEFGLLAVLGEYFLERHGCTGPGDSITEKEVAVMRELEVFFWQEWENRDHERNWRYVIRALWKTVDCITDMLPREFRNEVCVPFDWVCSGNWGFEDGS